MVDLVEKVARAICKEQGIKPDRLMAMVTSGPFMTTKPARPYAWELKIDEAKAAIRAMIEGLEPVAWRYDMNGTYPRYSSDRCDDMAHAWTERPLYDLSQLKEAVK